MKKMIVIALMLVLPGCSMFGSKNKILTTQHLDGNGNVVAVAVEKSYSDDSMYYEKAAEAIQVEAGSTCAPNCAPGELASIEAFKTIRALMGKNFVERGMNGVEALTTLGTEAIHQTPLGILAFGVSKAANRPNNVNIKGDGNSYSPTEYHWTGNTGSESGYSGPVYPVAEPLE